MPDGTVQWQRSKDLREERASVHDKMKKLVEEADPKKGLDEEKQAEWDRMDADFERLSREIERAEKIETRDDALARSAEAERMGITVEDTREGFDENAESRALGFALHNFAEGGRVDRRYIDPTALRDAGLPKNPDGNVMVFPLMKTPFRSNEAISEHLDKIGKERRDWEARGGRMPGMELRAETDPQDSDDNTEGGSFIAREFSGRLEQALLAFGGMRQARTTVIRTATGATMDWPTANDTDQKGALLAESTSDSVQIIDTGVKTLAAYKYTSKIVKVPNELMQDSAFDFASFVGGRLGERLGRIENEHATTGTGSSQPNGVVTASTAGVTAATESGLTADELIDLEHSVDPAYRPQAEYMMKDSTLKVIKKLKDSNNQYLFIPGIAFGAPNTIQGYNYVINQDMAAIAGAAKTVLFGDFSKFVMRDVLGVVLLRLNELYAADHQVGFLAFMRFDAELIDAGTNPIKHIVHPS